MGWDGQWDTHASVEGQVDIPWNVPRDDGMDNLRRFWTSMEGEDTDSARFLNTHTCFNACYNVQNIEGPLICVIQNF